MSTLRRSGILSLLVVMFLAPSLMAAGPFEGDWVADVASKVLPSVVNISSTKTVTVRQSPLLHDPFFREFFGAVPQERVQRSLGSGVIVSKDGFILTNNHVVGGADAVEVRLDDDRVFEARIIGTDPQSDVAIIKIEAPDLPAIAVGDSSNLRIGSFVLAVGNPFGIGQTVTMGIVSALGRSGLGITDYENFIQTDAAINPGNSGGALVNMHGELIGINTAILSRSGGNVGIGFAIPVNLAMHIKGSIDRYGKVVRGWLGVTVQDVSPKIAKALQLSSSKGVLVSGILDGSPAATSGIREGDVIVSIDGNEVNTASSLRYLTAELMPGKAVPLTVIRDGKEKKVLVTIGDLAMASTEPEGLKVTEHRFFGGGTFTELSPEDRERLGLAGGMLVLKVRRESPAESTGLRHGDVVLKINGRTTPDRTAFDAALKKAAGRKLSLSLYRGGGVVNMTIIR